MADNKTNKERLKEITDGIEQGIKELFQSDRYRSYLSVMSRFHRYSVNNTMLIYLQRPNASLVAGFNKWEKQFGRHVKKGEHGITIIAPTPFKKKIEEVKLDPDTNAPLLDKEGKEILEEKEISIPMFKPVKVFDVGQTYGKPLPNLAANLTGSVEQYEVFVEALRRSAPVPISFKAIEPNTDGFFNLEDQAITIREGMSQIQTICAMVHEIAHSKLHNYEKQAEAASEKDGAEPVKKKDRNTEEVEAESISYAVCQYYGIETAENSFGYIATWSQGKELKELRASLETINKAASELISDVDQHFKEICKERGIDPNVLTEQTKEAAEQEAALPPPSDAYQSLASALCDHLEQLYNEKKLEKPFYTMPRDDAVSGLAGLLRNGHFNAARNVLAEAAERSGISAPDPLSSRLEALSDQWDKGLSFKLEPGILQDGNAYVHAYEGETSRGILFTGPAKVCEELFTELNDGSMTVRQARALNLQWEKAGKDRPLGEQETLYLLDKAQILHIQASDEGFDYTLYDHKSMKVIDGGQFSTENAKMHLAETLMEGAFKEVCVLQGLDPKRVERLPPEKLVEIQDANSLPPGPDNRDQEENDPGPNESERDAVAENTGGLDTYPMPDEEKSMDDLAAAGYPGEDMLPLSAESAREFLENDFSVYAIVDGGQAELCLDTEEVDARPIDAVFAIPREEWEDSLDFQAAVQGRVKHQPEREAAFLAFPEDCFAIYQLQFTEATRNLTFVSYEELSKQGKVPERQNYNLIYTAPLSILPGVQDLESAFEKFNLNRPADFAGHSMSVSDIIAIKRGNEVSYHYCDSVGFKDLPGFNQPGNHPKTAELSTEDDYGMIGGIINNGPKQPAAAEREVKEGNRRLPSILDRLKQPAPERKNKTAPHKSAEKEI